MIRILVIMAMAIQALPLQACAIEQAVLGSSCHDADTAALSTCDEAAVLAFTGCPGHPGDPTTTTCICEIAPQPAQRNQPPAAMADTSALAPVAITFDSPSLEYPVFPPIEPSPPAPSARRCTPLLR